MVVFICNGCGKSLKKKDVDDHTYRCRSCHSISCMDCSKDFSGPEYADHISCIEEAEKEGGSGYVAKEHKGKKKQESWILNIQEYMQTTRVDPDLYHVLNRIIDMPNIPRKKAKFENFMKSLRVRAWLINKAWEVFSAANQLKADQKEEAPQKKIPNEPAAVPEPLNNKSKRKEDKHKRKKESDDEENNPAEDKVDEPKQKKKKKNKKQKVDVEEPTVTEEANGVEEEKENGNESKTNGSSETNGYGYGTPFKWKATITKCLQGSTDKGLKMNKLKKLVFSEYYAAHAEDEHVKSENELAALLNKKLSHRNDKYVVVKDRVKLRSGAD